MSDVEVISASSEQNYVDKKSDNEELFHSNVTNKSDSSSYDFISNDEANAESLSNSDVTNLEKCTETNLVNPEIESGKGSLDSSEITNKSEEEEWLDIIGSGDFKKKVIKPGEGFLTRPKRGELVTVDIIINDESGNVIEHNENLNFVIGEMDVIQGIDLAVSLMEKGERAKIIIPSRLAYGKIGRKPDIPPDTNLECEVELKDIEFIDIEGLTDARKFEFGNGQRLKGNYYYDRGEYLNAIACYERAQEYLEGIPLFSDSSNEELQKMIDVKIKIYNNLAAAHLKMEAYDAALKSVDFVLKIQPKNIKAYFRKGKILSAKGLIDEAINCMKTAEKLDPELKIIQQEILRLNNRKKREEKTQKAMYQRMFAQANKKNSSSNKFSKVKKWSLVAGAITAVAFSMIVYRQYHS